MKKLNVKTIGIAAAAAAMLALAGCGENNTASLPQESLPEQNIAAPQETAGTLLLSVNPAIELDYDMEGDVVRLNALNDDAKAVLAGYDSYYGRSAEVVAAELVGEIDEAGYCDTTVAGQERNIVTPVAGTTRDSIHTRYNKYGLDFYLIDTAGLRKKGKVTEDLEFYSVMRSIRAIESSDVCILMLDASQGVESQDLNIFNLIVRNRKGCVIVVNKWDLIPKDSNTMKEWRAAIAKKLAPFSDVPVIFTSVPDRQRILEVLQTALRVYRSRARRIPTSEFNDYILPIIEETPPPSIKGKYIRIKYAAQLPNPTPVFAFFVNLPQYIKDTYRRFLENKIREHWDFSGVPIQIYFRQK